MTLLRLIGWLILGAAALAPIEAGAAERLYYIAADEVLWDYAPSYRNNPITGVPFTKEESVFLRHAGAGSAANT